MANRSSFGEILRDPLVLTLLGVNAASNAAESYAKLKAQPDPNLARFVNAAMLEGQPVTTLPKEPGLFTSIGKMFGANPNVTASPEAMIQEQLTLRDQQEKQAKDALEARSVLGPTGMEAAITGGAFSNAATRGLFPGGKVESTPAEKRAQAGPKQTLIPEYPQTATGDYDPTRPEMRVPSTTTEPAPGYAFSRGTRRESIEEAGAKAYAETTKRGEAARALEQSQDLADATKGGQYYDINTGSRPPKGKFTVGSHPSNFVRLSEKGRATIDDRVAFNTGLDELQHAANALLVDTTGMSPAAAQVAINKRQAYIKYGAGDVPKWTGIGMFIKPTNADAIMLESGGKLKAIQMLTNMQHRYPNMKELVPGFEFIGNLGAMDKKTALTQIEKARVLGNSFARKAIDVDATTESPDVGESVTDWKSGK